MDDEARAYQVVGLSSDGTEIADLVDAMQDFDMHIRYETPPSTTSPARIERCYRMAGYQKEDGLRERLLQDHQDRMAKR